MEKLLVRAYYEEGGHPFVCHVNGRCTVEVIQEIEKEITEYGTEANLFTEGDGEYEFGCKYCESEVGDYGVVFNPGYWELDYLSFKSIDELIAEEGNPKEV